MQALVSMRARPLLLLGSCEKFVRKHSSKGQILRTLHKFPITDLFSFHRKYISNISELTGPSRVKGFTQGQSKMLVGRVSTG